MKCPNCYKDVQQYVTHCYHCNKDVFLFSNKAALGRNAITNDSHKIDQEVKFWRMLSIIWGNKYLPLISPGASLLFILFTTFLTAQVMQAATLGDYVFFCMPVIAAIISYGRTKIQIMICISTFLILVLSSTK